MRGRVKEGVAFEIPKTILDFGDFGI